MARNALTPAAAEALVESEAALLGLDDQPVAAIERAMLELLRLEARFETLAARAERRMPGRAPVPAPAARAARETALLAAFIDEHAACWDAPPSIAKLIDLLDCRDEAHLLAILETSWRAVREAPP